jgi:hypothetical protein
MELRDALSQIAEIRLQMARTELFRGYRAVPVAFSGLLALFAGVVQATWISDPGEQIAAYLTLWVGAAVISAFAAGFEMLLRTRAHGTALNLEITWLALGQFLPCLVAGGLVTLVLVITGPDMLWILPGIWQILFSLGIFASYRLLPRPTFGVAVFYLASGAICLALARGSTALSPWAMAVPFGVGQLYAAAVLYWTLERVHVEPES